MFLLVDIFSFDVRTRFVDPVKGMGRNKTSEIGTITIVF